MVGINFAYKPLRGSFPLIFFDARDWFYLCALKKLRFVVLPRKREICKKMIGAQEIARKLNEFEDAQREACEELRAIGAPNAKGFLEGSLFFTVEKKPFSGKIAAVDGGVLSEELHSFCLVVARSVAVCFDYERGKLMGQARIPQNSHPEAFAEVGLEASEFELYKTLVRLELEVARAAEAIEKFNPGILLLDGAILPLPHDKPGRQSVLAEKYYELVENYKKLFSRAIEKNCVLAGVVKDSTSRHFLKMVAPMLSKSAEAQAGKSNDSAFLHFLLREGERTSAFAFSENENPRLRDFGEIGATVCGVYLKPAKFDRPLRVDFLLPANATGTAEGNGGENAFVERLAGALHFLSHSHRAYAYPAVLIEADLRAALDGREIETAVHSILSKSGRPQMMMGLRRNTRPFR